MAELLLLLVGVLLVSLSAILVAYKPAVGWVALAAPVILAFDMPTWASVSLGPVSLTGLDVIAAVLVLSTMVRRPSASGLRLGDVSPPVFSLVALVGGVTALIALNLVRGALDTDLAAALNEARIWFMPLAAAWWTFVEFRRDVVRFREAFWRWMAWTSLALIVVALIHVVQYGLGGAGTAVRSPTGEILVGGRPITSGQALFCLLAAVYGIDRWRATRRRASVVLSMVLLTVCFVSQHRSVWVAGGVALIVVLLQLGARRLVGVALLGVTLVLGVLGGIAVAAPALWRNITESATDDTTYQGRLTDWVALISPLVREGGAELLLGRPLGTGWVRVSSWGEVVAYIPHNWYVTNLLRTGLLGIAIIAAATLIALYLGWKSRKVGLHLAVILALVVYCWPYNLDWYLAPVLAAAALLASDNGLAPREHRRTRRTPVATERAPL